MKPEEICKIVCEDNGLPKGTCRLNNTPDTCSLLASGKAVTNHYETVIIPEKVETAVNNALLKMYETYDKKIIPAKIAEAKKDLIALLDEAHDLLDAHNSLYATDQEYCSYCHAKAYNSTQGIIHYDNCIIKRIRQQLKKDMGV